MPRFFIAEENVINEKEIHIAGNDVKHIKNVLRLKKGDMLILCDGKKNEYKVSIYEFEKNLIKTLIYEKSGCKSETKADIILYQGIPKSDKMETIIKKSVELGISKIVPVITKRTVVHLKTEEDIEKKVNRWQRISLEAAKQSGRGIIPIIERPVVFEDVSESIKNSKFKFILYENEKELLLSEYFKFSELRNIEDKDEISFIVGPEGGFSEDEIKFASENNINSVSLGHRILRTETVALMIISIIIYEIGDV